MMVVGGVVMKLYLFLGIDSATVVKVCKLALIICVVFKKASKSKK